MRASNDFLVVGMVGLGTALFLAQLLIVSKQIVSADNRIQSQLAAEKMALPVSWIERVIRPSVIREDLRFRCCIPSGQPETAGPRPTVQIRPEYPQSALKAQLQGFVDLDFVLKADGSVADATVAAEVPQGYGFAAAATKVFPRWKFVPVMIDGKAITTGAHYRLSFGLPEN